MKEQRQPPRWSPVKDDEIFPVRWLRDYKQRCLVGYHDGYRCVLDENFGGEVPKPDSVWSVAVLSFDPKHRVIWVEPVDELEPPPEGTEYFPAAFLPDNPERVRFEEIANEQIRRGETGLHVFGPDDLKRAQAPTTAAGAAMTKDPLQQLKEMESVIRSHILGQDRAIAQVCRVLRRRFAMDERGKGPIASLFFMGPTGVGKSHTAKLIGELLGFTYRRFDMGAFKGAHQVARFIGSPPGYVGSDKGGQLTRLLRKSPRCLVLLDEIEKADPDILHAFLSIMEEGELEDASDGVMSDFSQAILVFTSNEAPEAAARIAEECGDDDVRLGEALKDVLQRSGKFVPEWVGRLNRVVYFRPLTSDVRLNILENLIYEAGRSVGLEVEPPSPEVLVHLEQRLDRGNFGARGMRSVVEEAVLDQLIDHKGRGRVRIEVLDGKIVVEPLDED